VAIGTLVLLFSPSAVRWWTSYESASSDNADPDTR
jgi:hypothetical protein